MVMAMALPPQGLLKSRDRQRTPALWLKGDGELSHNGTSSR
jgi:hypothetical protein